MGRDLGLDGVVDHFTLNSDEASWLRNKTGATRLGFAVQLKFLTWRGRFPKMRLELPPDAVEHVARQVGVAASELGFYDFTYRAAKRHRSELRDLTGEHHLDSGYPSADLITAALERGTRMVTPVLLDHSAQAKAHAGFDKNACAIDWKTRQVRCPAGKVSAHWNPVKQPGTDAIVITFSVRTCRPCPFQEQCTSSALGRHAHLAAQRTARGPRRTEDRHLEGQVRPARGSGEHPQPGPGHHRHTSARYRGLPKVRLQHAFSATALNVIRLDAYWTGHSRHHTRSSRLEHLAYRLTA